MIINTFFILDPLIAVILNTIILSIRIIITDDEHVNFEAIEFRNQNL